jgi:hypothetical protein
MPNEIFLELELSTLTGDFFWGITQSEIDSIANQIDGTYSLSPSIYTGAAQRYTHTVGSPYESPRDGFLMFWYCSPSTYTVLIDLKLCYASALNPEKRNLQISPSVGFPIFDTDLPDITDYCAGTAFSASVVGELRSFPDVFCGAQPPAFTRVAIFDLNMTFSV